MKFFDSGKGGLLSALCMIATMMAGAAEYYWVAGATDWASPASYANADGTAAGCVPSAGDELAIPANCTVTLDCDNAAHFEVANRLERVRPLERTSFFVVKVSEGKEATFNPKINYNGSWDYAGWYKGGLVKRGLGALTLGSGSGSHDYMTDITVEEGILKLPQNAKQYSWRYYDLIAVSNGATLFTCSDSNKAGHTLTAPLGLVGDGIVTNDCANPCYLEILGSGRNWSHEFAGRLTGNIMLNNGRTHFHLTGVNNTFCGIMAIRENLTYESENVKIGLKKIGMKADPESSAGRYNSSYGLGYRDVREWRRNHGSGYLYLGNGETTDKDLYVYASGYYQETDAVLLHGESPNYFDAGANGGVTFTGAFKMGDKYNQRFVLTGSNAAECVIAGPIQKNMDNGTNCNWRFTKKGTGTWRFADVANTEMAGVIAVEDGTLRYDSIAERGTRCSLGYSNELFEDYTGKAEDSRRVQYAFELGSETDASADPVFEYTGNAKGWCFTRPLAMKGSARLRHSGGGELRLAHLKTLNSTAKTLTLDGDGESAYLYNVCDSHGTLSLVKDGSGTWNIGGTNQISGTIAVKDGTLNLRHHEAPYTWFKWTHKGTVSNWETANKEIGLFGEDGIRLNSDLKYSSEIVVDAAGAMNLCTGEVAVASKGKFNEGYCPIEGVAYLFDNLPGTQWRTAYQPYGESTWRQAYPDDPTSWYSIVMRLSDDSPCVDSYDILSGGEGNYFKICASRAFSLHGSYDGVNWHELDDFVSPADEVLSKPVTWRFGGEGWNSDANCKSEDLMTHTTGKKILGYALDLPTVLANVTEISVAAGARLAVTGGDAVELRDGIKLVVDGTTGAGTLANMVLPENGTLELVNVPEFSGSLEMSITGENVTGLDNVSNWGLSVNGVVQSGAKYKCRYSNGKIVMYRPGTVVVFR